MALYWLNEGPLVQLGCIRTAFEMLPPQHADSCNGTKTSRFRLIRKIETCRDGKTCGKASQSSCRQKR
jgi:hypothetical protein